MINTEGQTMQHVEIRRHQPMPDWWEIRDEINQWIVKRENREHGNAGQLLRDIEDQCPGYSWMEIAGWIVGLTIPNIVQQRMLWKWLQTQTTEARRVKTSLHHSRSASGAK
jgi:hypothetical protein